jgi:hypothetical protein
MQMLVVSGYKISKTVYKRRFGGVVGSEGSLCAKESTQSAPYAILTMGRTIGTKIQSATGHGAPAVTSKAGDTCAEGPADISSSI